MDDARAPHYAPHRAATARDEHEHEHDADAPRAPGADHRRAAADEEARSRLAALAAQRLSLARDLLSRLDALPPGPDGRTVKQVAEARRLRWQPELTVWHRVSDDGTTLQRVQDYGHARPWAAGPPLPATGSTAWQARVHAHADADVLIGVCDAATCRHAWALHLLSGKLIHTSRDAYGRYEDAAPGSIVVADDLLSGDAHARAWPDGHGTQVVGDGLRVAASAGLVEVLVDADAGALGFRYNGGPLWPAIAGFPTGVALRPWAYLGRIGDSLTFEPTYYCAPRTRHGPSTT